MKVKYLIMFKSTYQILNNPWKEDVPNIDPFPAVCPPSRPWKENRSIELDDVNLWEQIYYEPGIIGVYASWDPKEEFYLVTYNFFLGENTGYKLLRGNSSVDDIVKELQNLGIDIPVNQIKID
jgi:hypothetical protein